MKQNIDDLADKPEQNFERWMETLRPLKGNYELVGFDPKTFVGSVESRKLFGFDAVDIKANIAEADRTLRDTRCDGLDSYYAVFQIAGRSTVIQGDVAAELSMGEVIIVDSARPVRYLNRLGQGQWLSLVLPRTALLSSLGFTPKFENIRRERGRQAQLLFELVSGSGQEEALSSHCNVWMQLVVYDLLGALYAPSEYASISAHSHRVFARVCDIIKCRFADPDISPQEIASAAGISLRYLQKLFTAHHTTCSRYITELRLEYAARLIWRRTLTKSGQPLSSIACASGYRDYSHFARAFRRRFGRAPGA